MRLVLRFLGFVLLFSALGLAVERLWWSQPPSPTYSEQTAALPELTATTQDGIVRIPVGDLEFRGRVANLQQKDAEAVVLLHGFPETARMWDPLIDELAARGYRVLAFDQRGYSPGARPSAVEDYRVDRLSDDVLQLADLVGFERFHLVGHDWGAAVGWNVTDAAADRVVSWTALSVPHISAFRKAVLEDPEQQQRSRYMNFFRQPHWAEFWLSFKRAAMLRDFVYDKHSDALRDHYTNVFLESGALTGALNWYRAIDPTEVPDVGPSTRPTLMIYGVQDEAVGRVAIDDNANYVTGPYRLLELEAGHFLMEEAPQEVIQAVLEHLNSNK